MTPADSKIYEPNKPRYSAGKTSQVEEEDREVILDKSEAEAEQDEEEKKEEV